ncbi:hypothetical protein MKK63_24720 [Methylobacterium sp. J-088]|uniref:hypothetical protein n=1 Tax=Methylobacterium sp. J-088 TaxID=2836664 RepID=UPI001FBA572C|nr:hypothetical protein [Methylobacterium sp. J-088]MCJ2065885.1 hypothetical protein [Methylobacterium sp. J-088]
MKNETPPFPAGLAQPAPLRQDRLAEPTPLGFGHALTPDPVDAAIERHRIAREELQRASCGVDAAMTASKQAEAEADAVFSAASNADGAAWADLIATRPSDVSGAVRLLRYVSGSPASEVVEDPQDLLRQLAAVVEAAEAGSGCGCLSAGPHPLSGTAANLDRTVAALGGLAGMVEPDPALAVVAEFRASWDALAAAIEDAGGVGVPDVDPAIEDREGEAYERLKTVRPTTPEGFRALAEAWAMVLDGERGGEPGLQHADHAADSLIAGAEACVPTGPVDWTAPPPGFMASPAIRPFGFVIVEEGIRIELERLHGIALAEFSRLFGPETTAEGVEQFRRELRLDALERAVRGEGGFAVSTGRASPSTFQEWQAEAARHPGFVPFPAHAPRILMALDEAIQREAGRLLELAEAEVERSRLAHTDNTDPTLWPRVERDMRCEMRMDALALVAAPLPDGDGAPDPVLAAIAASRRAEAETDAFEEAMKGDKPADWSGREDALTKIQQATREAVWRTVPTTQAGRLALVDYARFQVRLHTGETGIIDSAPDLFEEVLAPIAAAIAAERPEVVQHADATLLALGAEFMAAWVEEARAGTSEAYNAVSAVAARIAVARAETVAGYGIKALLVARLFGEGSSPLTPEAAPPCGPVYSVWRMLRQVQEGAARLAGVGVEASVTDGEHDLAGLPLVQLARLYEALEPFEDLIGRAENAACFWDKMRTERTAAGDIIYRESERIGRVTRAIAEEIERRQPADCDERDERLGILVRRAASLGGLTTDQALLTEALASCAS